MSLVSGGDVVQPPQLLLLQPLICVFDAGLRAHSAIGELVYLLGYLIAFHD